MKHREDYEIDMRGESVESVYIEHGHLLNSYIYLQILKNDKG